MGRFILFLLLIGGAVFAFGAYRGWFETDQDEHGQTSSYGVTVNHDKIAADRAEFSRQMEADVDRLQQRMRDLRERASEETGEARTKLDQEIEELQPKLDAAKRRFKEMSDASGEKWDEFKRHASEAVRDLEEGLDKAFDRFR